MINCSGLAARSSHCKSIATKTNRRTGVNRRASKNKSPETETNSIPPFVSDQVYSQTLRYYVPSVYVQDVLSFSRELPIPPFGVSDSSSQLILPFKAIRLKRIKLWCMYRPDQDIAGNTINLTIVDRRLCRPIEWSDTASFNCNAFLTKKFAKYDPLGQWYITNSGEVNPEIHIQMPKGSVLEMTFDYILSDGHNCRVTTGSSLSFPRVYTNSLSADLSVIGKGNSAVLSM